MPFWYFDAISPAWGHDPDPASWHMSAWQWNNIYGERPIEDTLSALIFDNVFGRHPNLRVPRGRARCRMGAALRHVTWTRAAAWVATGRGSAVSSPSGRARSSAATCASRPYPEDDIPWIVENLGHDDSIVMGSDFPHAEGLAEPAEFVKLLDPLDETMQRRIMRDNAEALFAR